MGRKCLKNGLKRPENYEFDEWREWGVKTGRADARRVRGGAERLKTGSETTKIAKNAKNGPKMALKQGI